VAGRLRRSAAELVVLRFLESFLSPFCALVFVDINGDVL
jgi:hypothetical protein